MSTPIGQGLTLGLRWVSQVQWEWALAYAQDSLVLTPALAFQSAKQLGNSHFSQLLCRVMLIGAQGYNSPLITVLHFPRSVAFFSENNRFWKTLTAGQLIIERPVLQEGIVQIRQPP